MNFFTHQVSIVRGQGRTVVGFSIGVLLAAVPLSGAIFRNGFVDHSICCGTGGPLSVDGTSLRGGGAVAVAPVTTAAEPANGGTAKPPAAPSGEPERPLVEVDGHLQLEFARLSDFKVEAPAYDPAVKPEAALAVVDKQIPEAIRQFDGRRAQVTGFMLPIKMEGQLVSQFLLMRDQMMCCYGVVPRMNEWVVVYTAKPVRYTPDVPVSFRGKLQVKAMQEQGFITGIYLLEEAVPGKK